MLLLLLRLLFGGLLLAHGLDKWIHFDELQYAYPDPMGVGSRFSLMLTIFAEVFCAGFVVLGLLTRPMCIPILVAMGVAWLVVHHGQPFASKELAFIFVMAFGVILFAGPGRYSMDCAIGSLILFHDANDPRTPRLDREPENTPTSAAERTNPSLSPDTSANRPKQRESHPSAASRQNEPEKRATSGRPLRHKEGPLG